MKTVYLYVPTKDVDKYIKYGIKLQENINKVIEFEEMKQEGIKAYLSPRDSKMYYNDSYTCLKINTNNLKVLIYDDTALDISEDKYFICDIKDYIVGTYEDPQALICSTILKENIDIYNKIIDTPMLIENSKEYYYKKCINEMLDNDFFTNYEIYQLLLILGQKKKILNVTQLDQNLKIYTDNKNNKKYTKKSNL